MPSIPYMPLYVERLFASARVRRMKWDERGAYLVLLAEAWMNGARLENDRESIRELLGIDDDATWKRIERFVLDRCFEPSEDGVWLVNPPQSDIYANTLDTLEGRSQKRREAANARWAKHRKRKQAVTSISPEPSEDGDREVNPPRGRTQDSHGSTPEGSATSPRETEPNDRSDMQEQCTCNASAVQVQCYKGKVNKENTPPTIPPRGGDADAEAIYAEYPRKVAKQPALKAITAALKLVPLETLRERTCAFASAVDGADPRYVPHPATWFNQRRWEDNPDEWTRIGRNGSGTAFKQADERKDYGI